MCAGDDTVEHYEHYEQSDTVARIVDAKCLSCPVLSQCLQAGVENNEWGVWGSIYLTLGKPDVNRNAHKTPEVWQQIRESVQNSELF